MKTITEIKELVNQAAEQIENLSRIARSEELEYGKPKEDTIILYNTLYFALNNAYDTIEKGLNGEF